MNDATLAAGVALIFLTVFGIATGSFTAVDASRDVNVSTAGDGYLGADVTEPVVGNAGERVTLLDLNNGFATSLDDVTVQVRAGGDAVTNLTVPTGIGVGETAAVTAELMCSGSPVVVTLDVSVAGTDLEVRLTRDVTVECLTPTSSPTSTTA
jgi:hypothetical protein